MLVYPPFPEPHTLEVEATNHCSARCLFCPNPRMTRPKGYLDADRFDDFLSEFSRHRDTLWLNRVSGLAKYPRVVFAGLGEPTLHARIVDLVRSCTTHGLRSQVVTNGAHLNKALLRGLIDAGLGNLAISLHTLNPGIYQSLMNLRLDVTLPRITLALRTLQGSSVAVELWRVLPPPGMERDSPADQEAFDAFVQPFPFVKVLGPSEPWDRDDTVPSSVWGVVNDDPSSSVWCHKLYLTHNIAWDGTAVMCCVDYHRITTPLGNVFEDTFEDIQRRRMEILRGSVKPRICHGCRRWADPEYADIFAQDIAPNLRGRSG